MSARIAVLVLFWSCCAYSWAACGDEPADGSDTAEMKRLVGPWNIAAARFPVYGERPKKDMSIEIHADKLTLRACPTLSADV